MCSVGDMAKFPVIHPKTKIADAMQTVDGDLQVTLRVTI